MSKRFIEKIMKATKDSGNAFFTKKNRANQQENIEKEGGQKKEKEVSLKERMMNAAKSINETTLKGYQQIKKVGNDKKEKQKLNESYDKLKEMGKNSWNQLKNNQFDKLNKLNFGGAYINKTVNQVKEKVEEGIKKFNNKDEKPKEYKQLQEKKPQSWLNSKMHILQAHLKTMKDMIEKQSKNATGLRFNIFSNIMEKMYWRVAFLLMLVVFAYGLGASLPRQIRKIYEINNRKDDQKVKKEVEGPGKLEQIANVFKAK